MDLKTLKSLNPSDNSSAAIEAALGNARAAKSDAQRRHENAKERLAGTPWSLTSAQRRELADLAEDAAQDMAQAEHIAGELSERLKAAQISEDHDRGSARRADIVKLKAESETEFEANYEKLAAPLRKMLADRKSKLDALNEFNATFGARFVDLVIPGAPEFYRPVDETRFCKSEAELAEHQQRLANQRIQDENARNIARQQRTASFEAAQRHAAQVQYDENAMGVFIGGVKQQDGTIWRR
jgi:hypothetical protein